MTPFFDMISGILFIKHDSLYILSSSLLFCFTPQVFWLLNKAIVSWNSELVTITAWDEE